MKKYNDNNNNKNNNNNITTTTITDNQKTIIEIDKNDENDLEILRKSIKLTNVNSKINKLLLRQSREADNQSS
jgi:hypothetical protein